MALVVMCLPSPNQKSDAHQRRSFCFWAARFIGLGDEIKESQPNKMGGHKAFILIEKKSKKTFPTLLTSANSPHK
jgi:hypothetical protein